MEDKNRLESIVRSHYQSKKQQRQSNPSDKTHFCRVCQVAVPNNPTSVLMH